MTVIAPVQDALASPGRPGAASAALCALCGEKAAERWLVCPCGARTHVECLARHYLQARQPASRRGTQLYVKLTLVCLALPRNTCMYEDSV